MPSFLHSELSTEVTAIASGSFSAANFLTVANRAVRKVLSDLNLRSSRRESALSPNLFNDVYAYTCPTDLKRLIDLKPQINRGRFDSWRLTSQEEFDRYKEDHRIDRYGDPVEIKSSQWLGENLVAFGYKDLTRILYISRPIDDQSLTISTMDSLTAGGGTWTLYGDGTNLTADAENYVKGSGSINWDISAAAGTTAGIYNSDINDFDISKYTSAGSALVWVYITSATNLTNFILRIGSGASAYYSITITTNNEGASFYAGWNLLRFSFVNKSTTGTPDDDACNYVALYMTKDGAKISETDYRFDNLVLKIGDHYNVIYYSKYLWQSTAGVWIEDATATTDVLNVDTDEYNLIIAKTAEYMEEHLKNYNQADRHKKEYEELKRIYILNNPSEEVPLTQTYFDF